MTVAPAHPLVILWNEAALVAYTKRRTRRQARAVTAAASQAFVAVRTIYRADSEQRAEAAVAGRGASSSRDRQQPSARLNRQHTAAHSSHPQQPSARLNRQQTAAQRSHPQQPSFQQTAAHSSHSQQPSSRYGDWARTVTATATSQHQQQQQRQQYLEWHLGLATQQLGFEAGTATATEFATTTVE